MRGEALYISGTFASSDPVDGVLTINYTEDVDTPLRCIIFDSLQANYSIHCKVTKVTDNQCTVNIGQRLKTGNYIYRLIYTNN